MSSPSGSPTAALEGDAAAVTTDVRDAEAMHVDPPTLESAATPSESLPDVLERGAAADSTAVQQTEHMSVDPPTLESAATPSESLPDVLERGAAADSTGVQQTEHMSVDPPTLDTTDSLTTPPHASQSTALSEELPLTEQTTASSKDLVPTVHFTTSEEQPPGTNLSAAFVTTDTTTSLEELPSTTALSEALTLSTDATTSLEELPPTTALSETLPHTADITTSVEELPPTTTALSEGLSLTMDTTTSGENLPSTMALSEALPQTTDTTTSLEELPTTSDDTPSFETATPTFESSVSLEYLETPEATAHVETVCPVQEITASLHTQPQTSEATVNAESRPTEDVATSLQALPPNENATPSEAAPVLTGCSLALSMASNLGLPEVLPLSDYDQQNPENPGVVPVRNVCTGEPLDHAAVGHFERSMDSSEPLSARLGDELLAPGLLQTLANTRGPDLLEGIVKNKQKENPGPSAAVGDAIPDQNIFSEPTEYEEEFLLTENMVNSYTFSDESKSTDYSNTDSPMDSNVKNATTDEHVDSTLDKPTSESVSAAGTAEVKSSTDAEKDTRIKVLGDEPNVEKDAETDIDTDLMTDAEEDALLNKSFNEDELLNTSDEIMEEPEVEKASETEKLTKSTAAETLTSKVSTEQVEKMDVDEPNIKQDESLKRNIEKTEDSDKQFDPEEKSGEKDKIDTYVITPIAEKVDNDQTKGSAMNTELSEKIDENDKKNTEKDGDTVLNVPGPSEPDKEKLDADCSEIMPLLEDSLGLLSEARTLLREDDDEDEEDEDDDDDNNDDDESNHMAPDSSEVESNAAVNEEPPDSDQLEDDTEPTGQSGLAVGQSEEDIDQSMEPAEQSLDVDRSMENVDQSLENVDQSMENVDQPMENVDQSIENVDQSMENIDQSLENIARAVMDYEEEDDGFEFTIAGVAGGDDDEEQKKDGATADDTQELKKDDEKKSPKRPNDSKEDSPPKDAVKPAIAPKPMDIDTPVETAKSDAETKKTPEVAEEKDVKKDDENSAKIAEVAEKPNEKAPKSPTVVAKSPTLEVAAEKAPDTPSKAKKLEIAKPGNVMSIVELEESSSDSDVQETDKSAKPTSPAKAPSPLQPEHTKEAPEEATTSVNIPKEIDIMSTSCGDTSSIITTQEENVISGIPAATPPKKSAPRINTSEITIKTTTRTPEPTTITISDEVEESIKKKVKPKLGLEVYNVDSDEEDVRNGKPGAPKKLSAIELQNARDTKKCINYICESDSGAAEYYPAPSFVLSYYEVKRSRRCSPLVCSECLRRVCQRTAGLMDGVRNMKPLLSLDMDKECQEFVEISDSDSDSDGEEAPTDAGEKLSAANIKVMEESLAQVLNETWRKYGLAGQLRDCEQELKEQLHNLEKASEEIDDMLADSQKTMDKLRNELYGTFASEVRELEPIEIDDGASRPVSPLLSTQPPSESSDVSDTESRRSKRQRKAVNYEETRVRSPIPLGYAHLDTGPAITDPAPKSATTPGETNSAISMDPSLAPKPADDNADVSVVRLSAEVAPAGLPAPGELQRPTLRFGDSVYAVRQSSIGSWAIARVLEIFPPGCMIASMPALSNSPFTTARIRFEHKLKGSPVRQLTGKELAYTEPAPVRLTIGTRVIALFKDLTNALKRESYYSGIIAEAPTPVNSYRYLVFFDDGYAQYVAHAAMRVVYETSARVWDDVHADSREFVRKYLVTYPERPMVRLQTGQALKTEWNGKWWVSRVVGVDASLVQVLFEADGRIEWIYRGSTRLAPLYLELQAAERHRPRGLTRLNKQAPTKANMPYVEYTRSDEQDGARAADSAQTAGGMQHEESRRMTAQQQRSVAKKSTAAPQVYPPQRLPPAAAAGPQPLNDLMTRVVYYSPKAAVSPYKMVPHTCSSQCRRPDVLPLKELKTYNPLTRPLLIGWERQILRFKGKKVVMYRAPCGRRVRDMRELHRYLRAVQSDCSVDLFDFNHTTHCLAEFVLNKCYVSKKDLSHGKENVPVPCVNYYDGTLPEFCLYNTERTPTSGVPLNLDPDFLCGCDCTDDCQDKSKCACWKLTLEGARTIGLDGADVGYHYKRLPEPLSSGIYECNSRCKCAQTCLNRVAQHPLQLKLQVFKTLNRGWGIRALNDVPKGAFLCVYAGNLLTDATANLDGINEGDEYLAELDYIEVVERMKEGYESDVQEEKRKRKLKGSDGTKSDEEDEEEDEEDEEDSQRDEDADFQPEYIGPNTKFTKSLRKRGQDKDRERVQNAEGEGEGAKERTGGGGEDDLITISDDEEVREPSRFTAQTGLNEDDRPPRHVSVRSFYGKDEACYIMDAKVQGNIGRYLNHSCTPNVFVQNVFVDTHDPRFPWVAFFALTHIQAGSELTWNYNYDVGSVPDKVLYCKCGAPNCRGRLL